MTSFSHTRPNGQQGVAYILAQLGGYVGKYLARGHSTPEAVVNAWMASSSHKKILLSSQAKTMAIAFHVNSASSTYYWVLSSSSTNK